ncbi:MAG: NAD-dependent epimerase/dehydratase family protein [Cyanothece sp. SIO1E1]|nr:NAD-dependent epimerase/dehydratase family protein [Cyanothece sp. SIO1E1]
MKKILLTGASGFIGSRFQEQYANLYQIVPFSLQTGGVEDIDFADIDAIVHLAGIAHRMEPTPDELYYRINHGLTIKLATAARGGGVRHFVFMSTIKVYGEIKEEEEAITEKTDCQPSDAYGESKRRAEVDLRNLEATNFRVAIVRTPVVYGPGVKGNIKRIMELANRPIPLPFGKIENARSMVALDNLLALLERILNTNASGTFLPTDPSPLSTTHLVSSIRKELGHRPKLVALPLPFRWLFKRIKPQLYTRLFGSLRIEGQSTNQALEFSPPFTTDQGIKTMVQWYKSTL